MPRFQIEDGGKRFEIEAPDMDAAVAAIGEMRSAQPGLPQGQSSLYDPKNPVISDDPRYWPPQEPAEPWWKFSYGPFSSKAPGPERGTFVPLASGPSGKIEPAMPGIFDPLYKAPDAIMRAAPGAAPQEGVLGEIGTQGLTAAGAAQPAVVGGRLPTAPRPMVSLNPKTAAASRVSAAALEDAELKAGIDSRPNLRNLYRRPGKPLSRPPLPISARQLAANAARLIREGLAAGQDLRMFDVGGESTLSETRRAADMSSRAQANMSPFAEERWKQQGFRVAEWMRNRMGNPREAHLELDAIRERARDPTSKAYVAALTAGQRNFTKEGTVRKANPGGIKLNIDLLGIMNDPTMLSFVRDGQRRFELARAADLTVDKATVRPYKNGRLNPDITLPLDFWDYVKRSIDDAITKARVKSPTRATMLGTIRQQFVDELDRQVPAYKAARGIAAEAFKAGDAVEAGIEIAGNRKILRGEIDKVRKKTPPAEWGRVQIGFFTEWMRRALSTGDRSDILRRIAENPIERQKIEAVLGPDVAKDLEGVMYREDLMQKAYRALRGGSMSPRRNARMYSPSLAPSAAISAGALLFTQNLSSLIVPALLYGVRRAEMNFQYRVAEHVADLLISKDPRIYMRGIWEGRQFLPNLRRWILAGGPTTITQDVRRDEPVEPGIEDTSKSPAVP